MNYKKIYYALVEKAKVRGLDKSKHEGYFEIHHVVPRCLGGSDDASNLVMFTMREHILSHVFLWRAYPKHLGIVNAAEMMTNTREYGRLLPSKILSRLRAESSALRSLRTEGAGYGETRHIDLAGKVFGRLTVENSYEWHTFPNGQRKARWDCVCECGNSVKVLVTCLQTGSTQSCGCLHKERTSEANKKWEFSRKTYEAYHNMVSRCYSPKHRSYENFRKYNISICGDWLGDEGIANFAHDMGEKPEGLCLVRIDPFGDFCKDNCAWVTKSEASKAIYKFPRQKVSRTGVLGIKYDKRRNTYTARVMISGKEKSKTFKTLEEAVEFREFLEKEIAHSVAVKNA